MKLILYQISLPFSRWFTVR